MNENCQRLWNSVNEAWGQYVRTLNDRNASQASKNMAAQTYNKLWNDWVQSGCGGSSGGRRRRSGRKTRGRKGKKGTRKH